MDIKIHEGAVPFVITYRKIIKRPKVRLVRKRLGLRQILSNIYNKVVDFYESIAVEVVTEVADPGHSVAVHWAFSVEDPWDVSLGREVNLVGVRMLNDVPPSGCHFEIITPTTSNNSVNAVDNNNESHYYDDISEADVVA